MAKEKRTVSLSPEAVRLLWELARRLGVSQSGVLELAIRDYARSQGVSSPEEQEPTK